MEYKKWTGNVSSSWIWRLETWAFIRRVERYLQLCDENEFVPKKFNEEDTLKEVNMLVVNCSTAANYFHLLI